MRLKCELPTLQLAQKQHDLMRKVRMDIAAYVFVGVGGLILAFAGLHGFENKSVTIVAFGVGAILIIIGGCCYWQDAIWKSEARQVPDKLDRATDAESKPTAQPPISIRLKYSSRQTIEIANVPGDYNQSLNREVVTLVWPILPSVTIAEPKGEEKYRVPGGVIVTVPQAGNGLEVRGLTIAQGPLITFDSTHSSRLFLIGERLFRVSLVDIRDKSNAEHQMFLQYEFAISEEDVTPENRAAAIVQGQPVAQGRVENSVAENLLKALNTQPIGTIELRLRDVIDGKPNTVQLIAGSKAFVFDPVAKLVVFRMVTSQGKSVNLQLHIKQPAKDGRYFVVFPWDVSKGAQLHLNDKYVADGL